MAENLQKLVDSFAERFNRAVAVDDFSMSLLAHSAHQGDVDEARITSIMQRAASTEEIEYSTGRGALEATDLFLDPPFPEIGQTIARIAMPIRYDGRTLGFIWLMESDGPVTRDLHDALRTMADEASLMLHRAHALTVMRRDRESDSCRGLLSNDVLRRTNVARELLEERLLETNAPVVAFYLLSTAFEVGHETEKDRLAIAAGLDAGKSFTGGRKSIAMTNEHHGLLLVSWRADSPAVLASKIGEGVHEAAVRISGRGSRDWWIGIGRPAELEHAPDTHSDARRAAQVAGALRAGATVTRSDSLGVYGILSEMPSDRLRVAIDPRYLALAEEKGHDDVLVETLEVYLDNAGSVQKTYRALNIERASLYYRLRRIQEIAAIDLSDGNDRLSIHHSLKVARLLGLR